MFLQNKTRKDFLKRIFRKLKKKKKKHERNRTFITKFSIDPLIRKLMKIVGSVFYKFYTIFASKFFVILGCHPFVREISK